MQNSERRSREQPLRNPETVALLSRAEVLPVVQNHLMSPEQAAYCLGWRDQLNPESRPFRLLYTHMGPDVSTSLTMTDADVIDGVDRQFPSGNWERLLEQWDQLDDPASMDEATAAEFKRVLDTRYKLGYYRIDITRAIGLDRVLLMELKRLGVDPKSIRIDDTADDLNIQYELGKPRRLSIHRKGIHSYLKEKPHPEQFDAFYQKAGMNSLVALSGVLPEACQLIKPGGFFLSSVVPFDREQSNTRRDGSFKFSTALTEQGFEPMVAKPSLNRLIVQMTQAAEDTGWFVQYGAYIQGAKKPSI
jgi:hypothetical protein